MQDYKCIESTLFLYDICHTSHATVNISGWCPSSMSNEWPSIIQYLIQRAKGELRRFLELDHDGVFLYQFQPRGYMSVRGTSRVSLHLAHISLCKGIIKNAAVLWQSSVPPTTGGLPDLSWLMALPVPATMASSLLQPCSSSPGCWPLPFSTRPTPLIEHCHHSTAPHWYCLHLTLLYNRLDEPIYSLSTSVVRPFTWTMVKTWYLRVIGSEQRPG